MQSLIVIHALIDITVMLVKTVLLWFSGKGIFKLGWTLWICCGVSGSWNKKSVFFAFSLLAEAWLQACVSGYSENKDMHLTVTVFLVLQHFASLSR